MFERQRMEYEVRMKDDVLDRIFCENIQPLIYIFRRGAGRVFFIIPCFFLIIFIMEPGLVEAEDISGGTLGNLVRVPSPMTDDGSFSDPSFPTIYKTGLDLCTDTDGHPVIFMFSSSSCSHCEWSGEIFDFIVKFYTASGLVEAHHYDLESGDDLLTEEVETQIPPDHLQLKEQGDPKGLVPYFNFSCKYERVGNGYEKEDDIAAEGAEIRKAIEAVVEMASHVNLQ